MYVPAPELGRGIERQVSRRSVVNSDWNVLILGDTTYCFENAPWDLPLDPADVAVTDGVMIELEAARRAALGEENTRLLPPPNTYVGSTEQQKMTFGEYARLCVNGANPNKPTIDPKTTLGSGQVGAAIHRSGRSTPTCRPGMAGSWESTGLPPGLTIVIRTVVGKNAKVVGNPTRSGEYQRDAQSHHGVRNRPRSSALSLKIEPGLPPDCSRRPAFHQRGSGFPIRVALIADGYGSADSTGWTVSGLPAGLEYEPTTGVISGTPAGGSEGQRNVTVQAKSAAGRRYCR